MSCISKVEGEAAQAQRGIVIASFIMLLVKEKPRPYGGLCDEGRGRRGRGVLETDVDFCSPITRSCGFNGGGNAAEIKNRDFGGGDTIRSYAVRIDVQHASL
jgi:hypothetical protein